MTRDDIIGMAREAGMGGGLIDERDVYNSIIIQLERFAQLVAAAERNKVAAWMIKNSYATGHGDTVEDLLKELEWQAKEREREQMTQEGWRQCAKGQRTTQFCGQLQQAVEDEREACAQLCEVNGLLWGHRYAVAIRARGNP